jgi:hypothetical protein
LQRSAESTWLSPFCRFAKIQTSFSFLFEDKEDYCVFQPSSVVECCAANETICVLQEVLYKTDLIWNDQPRLSCLHSTQTVTIVSINGTSTINPLRS